MTKTKLVMIVVLVLVALAWLLSGILTAEPPEIKPSLAAAKQLTETQESDLPLTSVRASRSSATEQSKTIVLRGRVIDKNKVTVTAETTGQIVKRPAEIGDVVSNGEILCQLAVQDRVARLSEAEDALTLAEREYASSLKLSKQGFQQELATARFKAARSEAQRQLVTNQIELENTNIRAPISGVIHELHASVGDFLQPGSPCATILVLNPIYAQGFVTEEHVNQVRVGSTARVTLPYGEVKNGTLTFLSKLADEQTRTFRIEVSLPNQDHAISSGLSASIELITDSYDAHKIPTSVIVLDEFGNIGVKTIGANNQVEFYDIEIVREDSDGIWVAGLPTQATIITVGQGLVVAGERVAFQLGE